MTRRQKFSGYNQRELRAAFNEADSTVKKFHAIYNSGAKITEAQKEAARESLEDRDYLSGRIDQVESSGGRSPAGASGSYISGPRTIDYAKIGEDLQAMIAATMPADYGLDRIGRFPIGTVDSRLRNMRSDYRNAATGAGETVPSDGGFVVGTDLRDAIDSTLYGGSALLPMLQEVELTTNANSLKINLIDQTSRATGSRFGGVTGYWLSEGTAITASKAKLRQMNIELSKVAALVYATDELMQDATAFGRSMVNLMGEELRFQIQDAVVNGSGAGKPQGILNSPALVSVAKETGQAAATVEWANITKMWARYIGGSPVWLINRDIVPQLYSMNLAVGTGGAPVYIPASQGGTDGAARAPLNMLLGAPVIELEQCATLGTVGDILLIDPLQYVLGRKRGIQTAMSIHVQFLEDETVLRSIARVDGNTVQQAPVTPFKGSATRSPFVALATRS